MAEATIKIKVRSTAKGFCSTRCQYLAGCPWMKIVELKNVVRGKPSGHCPLAKGEGDGKQE